jgi:hypothetical protein
MASLRKRCGVYYIQYSVGGKKRRVSTRTGVLQLAKEKLRRLEDGLALTWNGANLGLSPCGFFQVTVSLFRSPKRDSRAPGLRRSSSSNR